MDRALTVAPHTARSAQRRLTATSPSGTGRTIHRLFFDQALQWVLGRNLTSPTNIFQLDDKVIAQPHPSGSRLTLPLLEVSFHLFFTLILLVSVPVIHPISAHPVTACFARHLFHNDWFTAPTVLDRVQQTHVGTVAVPSIVDISSEIGFARSIPANIKLGSSVDAHPAAQLPARCRPAECQVAACLLPPMALSSWNLFWTAHGCSLQWTLLPDTRLVQSMTVSTLRHPSLQLRQVCWTPSVLPCHFRPTKH